MSQGINLFNLFLLRCDVQRTLARDKRERNMLKYGTNRIQDFKRNKSNRTEMGINEMRLISYIRTYRSKQKLREYAEK